jgi:beta-lactamase regulating signal transducer with metallopeptidase domain
MMLELLLSAAVRTLLIGCIVGLSLRLLRVRNPHVEKTAWLFVLLTSFVMPALVSALPAALPREAMLNIPTAPVALDPRMTNGAASTGENPVALAHQAAGVTIPWGAAAAGLYALVAMMLLLRISLGMLKARRLIRAAAPVSGVSPRECDIRISDRIATPFSFGALILLPAAATHWPAAKLDAVLAHERSHIERRDFAIQLLASLNCAVFWISPLSWWLKGRLAALAETISDDAALDSADDAPGYAEILLEIAREARPFPLGVSMARGQQVTARIERVLAGAARYGAMGARQRAKIALLLAPLVITAAWPASRLAAEPAADSALSAYVGYYQLENKGLSGAILSITQDGDHLYAQLAEQQKVEVFANGPQAFDYRIVDAHLHFAGDGRSPSPSLILTQNGREMTATRIPAAAAQSIEQAIKAKAQAEMQPRKQVGIDPAILDNYIGRYATVNADFDVTRKGEHLYVKLGSQPSVEVFAEGPHDFFYTVVAAQITFETGPDGKATQLILHQAGMDIAARRIE